MLKRQQVLINNWLITHLQKIAKKYDVSYSEIVRIMLCCQVIKNVKKLYPKESIPDMEKEFDKLIKNRNTPDKYEPEIMHNFFSNVYFEARKAIEIWDKKAKKDNYPICTKSK